MSSLVKNWVTAAAITTAIIVVTTAVVVIRRDGGIREELQLPASIWPTSSAKQDGFALVDVTRGNPADDNTVLPNGARMFLAVDQNAGDTVLWIAPPVLPPTRFLRATTIRESDTLQTFYTITVVSSAGDHFQIPWHYEGGCLEDGGEPCFDTRAASSSPHLIAAVIPSGYPSDVCYFDVTISDRFGHKASWRLIHLPEMTHAPSGAVPTYSHDGIVVSLTAKRYVADNSYEWPVVKLTMTVNKLPEGTRHKWALFQRRDLVPSLSWQARRPWWMKSTSDRYQKHAFADYWVFSHEFATSAEFAEIRSPYRRRNDTATLQGVLSEFETRIDSVHLKNVVTDTIQGRDAGFISDTYSLNLSRPVELISGSGLTFQLPRQRPTAKSLLLMTENSLNLYWKLSPVSPGRNSETAAFLPDSPLCRKYKRPVAVWFEATADGKELGICSGLPDRVESNGPIMVHFPSPIVLPRLIHDLKITVHQRVDLQRIPITLTAPIENGSM